jgi:hypothetical protein
MLDDQHLPCSLQAASPKTLQVGEGARCACWCGRVHACLEAERAQPPKRRASSAFLSVFWHAR